MTAPSLLDELEGVVRPMEAATPGEWFSQASDPAEGVDCFWLMSLQASKALTEEVGSVNGSQWDDTQRANAELIARAVNFIRTHHAEIAEAVRDKARMDWLCSDEVHWIEIQSNPRGDYVYVGTDDRTPLRRKIDAAIDATQEGEG